MMDNKVLITLIVCIAIVLVISIICIAIVAYEHFSYRYQVEYNRSVSKRLEDMQKQTNEIYTMYRKILEEVREERNE